MIFPVGPGWQEGIPSPNFYLIVASGHSPLSFALGRWSPQHSILGTQSPLWMARRYPFSQYCLIAASGHSPLGFVLGHWSP